MRAAHKPANMKRKALMRIERHEALVSLQPLLKSGFIMHFAHIRSPSACKKRHLRISCSPSEEEKKRKEKKKKRKRKIKEKKKKRRREKKKRKEREREDNAGAARSAAGGGARRACPSRSPRAHGQLPAVAILRRLPGGAARGTARETVARRVPAGPGRRAHAA